MVVTPCPHHLEQIVALANLLPAAAETDDLDSYMYQTVGHQASRALASSSQASVGCICPPLGSSRCSCTPAMMALNFAINACLPQVISAYAACASLPLYRRAITGSTRQTALVYEDTRGDEVEDLAALLAYIKVPGPSSG